MTTDDDPPEPGSQSRDPLLEQADAAHERAVRRLQDDVRLADRFHELERGSKDVLFYRINKRPTQPTPKDTKRGMGPGAESVALPTIDAKDAGTTAPSSEKKTVPGLGTVEAAAEAATEPVTPISESPAPGPAALLPAVSVEPRAGESTVPSGSRKNLIAFAIVAAVGIVIAIVALRSGSEQNAKQAATSTASAIPSNQASDSNPTALPEQTSTVEPAGSVPPTPTPATSSSSDPPPKSSARPKDTAAPSKGTPTSSPGSGEFSKDDWRLRK